MSWSGCALTRRTAPWPLCSVCDSRGWRCTVGSRRSPTSCSHLQRIDQNIKGPLLYSFSSIYYSSQCYTKHVSEVFGSKYLTDRALQHPINPSVSARFQSADSLSVTLDENKEPLPTPLRDIWLQITQWCSRRRCKRDQDKKRGGLFSWNFQNLFTQRTHIFMYKRHEQVNFISMIYIYRISLGTIILALEKP